MTQLATGKVDAFHRYTLAEVVNLPRSAVEITEQVRHN